ncbi:MAG: hypothetical protein COA54_14810 [Thiotrichaceae bacterium]|nr:MAG: hypothetical protein COA54_14810 [Thiotrichaceae bacterium]
MDSFILMALLAGIALALVAAPLGCIVVWRRMAYFGDTLAHAALLGVSLSIALQVLPVIGVTVIGILLASLLYWLERQRDLSTDTLLGILSHSALAAGLIMVSLLQAQGQSINLMAYLFGDILAINQQELIWMYVGVVVIMLVFTRLWSAMVSIAVNEELARIDGVNVNRDKFIFMLLLAMVIAVAIKVVGILLITALLIIPAASARLFSKSPVQMVYVAIGFAVAAVIAGLTGSLLWDLPAGPAIVVMAASGFLLARIIKSPAYF